MCKPNKTGFSCRWTPKERSKMEEDYREIDEEIKNKN